ncbi:GNAT family N-acetyltransferase [Luedemannella helvata]|uniref:N-acetyltransferase domain-containing protein n=1 Tax=Luedemannella helvata TaxID=349315 RepID=A0ABN2KYW8_9ACTN
MTETMRAQALPAGLTIRPYRPSDHGAVRRLWAEFTEHQRRLYQDPRLGGRDPGAGFEEYLTRLDLSGIWVADEREEGVVGFVGLIMDGRAGKVDPVVVSAPWRGRGVGRGLLTKVADEAGRRGLARLTVSPGARDDSALRSLHAAGFDMVATVTLSRDLRGGSGADESAGEPILLHGLRFST